MDFAINVCNESVPYERKLNATNELWQVRRVARCQRSRANLGVPKRIRGLASTPFGHALSLSMIRLQVLARDFPIATPLATFTN